MKAIRSIKRLAAGQSFLLEALGDSLTSGWMVQKGYLDFLNDMLQNAYLKAEIKLNNLGLPGDTARGGLFRLQHQVIKSQPDAVLIQFGINDLYSDIPANDYKSNVEAMVHLIQEKYSAEIILVTSVCFVTPGDNAAINTFYQKLAELSEDYGLPLVKVHEYWRSKLDKGTPYDSIVKNDYVHPTEAGYQLMAEAIMQVFESSH
jgi:acyl-CoA thioesterase I